MAQIAVVPVSCDTSGLLADLALLAEFAQRSLQVRQRLIDLGDLAAHLRCVHLEQGAALGAGQVGQGMAMAWLSSTEFMGRSFLFPRPTGRVSLSSVGGLLRHVCLSQQCLRNAAHVGGISGRGLRGFFGGRSV